MGSEIGGTLEDPGGGFFKFAVKRALRQESRPNSPYGGETSIYLLLQQGVINIQFWSLFTYYMNRH